MTTSSRLLRHGVRYKVTGEGSRKSQEFQRNSYGVWGKVEAAGKKSRGSEKKWRESEKEFPTRNFEKEIVSTPCTITSLVTNASTICIGQSYQFWVWGRRGGGWVIQREGGFSLFSWLGGTQAGPSWPGGADSEGLG
jgi:hypothetical protein